MSRITFCIPTKDNLRYLKGCISSIRKNASTNPDIIVFVDSSNDGTVEWLTANNVRFLINETNMPKGIAYGYNRCVEAADTEVVCMFHADMYMAPGFDEAILKYMEPRTVVAGTRIEPPLHPEGLEKIVKTFGMYPEDFQETEFLEYTAHKRKEFVDKTTRGIFAPWAILKNEFISLGLHDENLHSFHEDSDIFNRFVLSGMSIVQTWEGYVYHLTCRGGQFQDGVHKVTDNPQFHFMKYRSMKEFIRKWGQFIQNDEYHYPIIQPRYITKLVIKNATLNMIQQLEPWFDYISVEDTSLVTTYIKEEQPYTLRNLTTAFTPAENDIVVTVDALTFSLTDYRFIQSIPALLSELEAGAHGTYAVGNIQIDIKKIEQVQLGIFTHRTDIQI